MYPLLVVNLPFCFIKKPALCSAEGNYTLLRSVTPQNKKLVWYSHLVPIPFIVGTPCVTWTLRKVFVYYTFNAIMSSTMFDLPPDVQKEKDDRKIKGATKIEQERFRKKNVSETEDLLDATGSPNEKEGIKATGELYKQYEKENFRIKSDRIEWLNKKAKYAKDRKKDYFIHVKTLVDYELSYLELPYGYSVKAEVTDRGIKIILYDRFGGLHAGAFAPSGLGIYDEQAARSSVNRIDDLITKLENNPATGIYLPHGRTIN